MTKRVYFTTFADDPGFLEASTRLLDECWPVLELGRLPGNEAKLCTLFTKVAGVYLFNSAAQIIESLPGRPRESMRRVAMQVLGTAVFAEALSRWPGTEAVDAEFREKHCAILDAQMQYYEYTADRAAFFALMHVCLGDLCEASDARAEREGHRIHSIPATGDGQASLFSLLTPIYERVRVQGNAEADLKKRLKVGAREFFEGAESLLYLAEMQSA